MSRGRTLSVVFVTAALIAGLVPASSASVVKEPVASFASDEGQGGLGDLDARQGTVRPTRTQVSAVSNLGARATWSPFGTPSTLMKDGGYLATGLSGGSARLAALRWVGQNRSLLGLSSTKNLQVLTDAPLSGIKAYAVVFGQEFGGLQAKEGGIVTVGIQGSAAQGWKVAWASSTATRSTSLAASPSLTATEAWLKAAESVGQTVTSEDIRGVKRDRDWSVFVVKGFSYPQRARQVAVPTPRNGVRPAWEVLLVDGVSLGFHVFVDAATGAVLVRKDLVENSHPPATAFTGAVPATDGACDVDKPIGTVTAMDVPVRQVQAVAEAALTTNDMVILLVRNGVVVASGDTLFSPETVVYRLPANDPGLGTYAVRVCDFVDGVPWDPPTNYVGQAYFSPVSGQSAVPYPPKWKVFPAYPQLGNLNAFPWNYPSNDIRETWCWEIVAGCDREVQNLASRVPWDYDPTIDAPTFTTEGNNAITAEAWTSAAGLTPAPYHFRPFSPTREYLPPWTNEWYEKKCEPTFVPGVSNDISAAVTNLFVQHNRTHDWSYFLGFTEGHWNAQLSNFGTGGTAEGDPLIGNVQSGGEANVRNNANMFPTPDGVPPITNQFLFQPGVAGFYVPCVDGDYDQVVVGHEYGHLTENRLIGKGSTRTGHHAGSMGESFGDLSGMEYVNEYGFVPVSNEDPFATGAYATGNQFRGIRDYNMSWPRIGSFPRPGVIPRINPLNFSDIGFDTPGPEVHSDGEIWNAVNFDIRQALIRRYGAGTQQQQVQCADGERPANLCPGNRRWMQLYFDAMILMPVNTTMLQARNAFVTADQMRFGGKNRALLWEVFARRGFGDHASSSNTGGDDNTDPTPNFESEAANNEATVRFITRDAKTGKAVKAKIFVGHYEARVSPIADTNPSTSAPSNKGAPGNNLDAVARFVPGTYEFELQAPGYGHGRFRLKLGAGQSITATIRLQANVASMNKGATAVGDGANHNGLIDDTENTSWDDAAGGMAIDVANPQVTINLAGSQPVKVGFVQVSAMLHPGQTRYSALRQFEVWSSKNGVNFTKIYTSPKNAFPGVPFRPVAPDLILRAFNIPDVTATHLRIVVLNNQCTGNPDFQGEQDNDPTKTTDCRAVSANSTEVHAAEFQAFAPVAAPTGDGDDGEDDDGDGRGDDDLVGPLFLKLTTG